MYNKFFGELIDVILNAILFIIIAFVLLLIYIENRIYIKLKLVFNSVIVESSSDLHSNFDRQNFLSSKKRCKTIDLGRFKSVVFH